METPNIATQLFVSLLASQLVLLLVVAASVRPEEGVTQIYEQVTQPSEIKAYEKQKTEIKIKGPEIRAPISDFVVTDREFKKVLKRLRSEFEAEHKERSIIKYAGLASSLANVASVRMDHESGSDQELPCAICLDELKTRKFIILECSHKFHSLCLLQWELLNSKCPICSSSLRAKLEVHDH